MSRKLDDVLDECLERIFSGESVDDCLNAYLGQGSQLEPLLKTSLDLKHTASTIQASPEFKVKLGSRLQGTLHARQEKEAKKTKIPLWHKRWAVGAAITLVMVFCGVGMVAASGDALPGDSLYAVKLAAEQVRLTLGFSDIDKAKLHIQFAERRAAEIEQMASKGQSEKIPELAERLDNHLQQVSSEVQKLQMARVGSSTPTPSDKFTAAGDVGELKDLMGNSSIKSYPGNALSKVPPSVKPRLEQAIGNYDKAFLELAEN